MVAYDIKNDVVEIITVHPIGRGHVEEELSPRGDFLSEKILEGIP